MSKTSSQDRSAALYARISTDRQSTENQLRELREVAMRVGWKVVAEYIDHGFSGAKGRDRRPQFDALCTGAVRREFDVVMAWSVDRLGRSLQHLITFLGEVHASASANLKPHDSNKPSPPIGRPCRSAPASAYRSNGP